MKIIEWFINRKCKHYWDKWKVEYDTGTAIWMIRTCSNCGLMERICVHSQFTEKLPCIKTEI